MLQNFPEPGDHRHDPASASRAAGRGNGTRAGEPTEVNAPTARDRQVLRSLVFRLDPRDAAGFNNLGVLFFNRGMIQEAVEVFHRALELEPDAGQSLRNLEIAYLSTGYYESLVEVAQQRLHADPQDRELRWRLARAHRLAGNFPAARSHLRKLLAEHSGEPRFLLELGGIEKEAGHFPAAVLALERALASDPEQPIPLVQLAELLFQQGNLHGADKRVRQAQSLEPDLVSALELRARICRSLGDGSGEAEALDRLRILRAGAGAAGGPLAIDRNSAGRYQELLGEELAGAGLVSSAAAPGRYALGLALRARGRLQEALREFDAALAGGEDHARVLEARAETLLILCRNREAVADYRKLIDRDGGRSPKLWNELGVCSHRGGDLETAELCYRRAVQAAPEYGLAISNLAVLLVDRGNEEDAERELRRACALANPAVESLCNLALLLHRRGSRDEALECYRRATEAAPDAGAGWIGLGALLSGFGSLPEARNALARAVELAPESAEARYRLAFLLNRTGDLDGSLRETRRALALNPYFTEPGFRLGIDLQFQFPEALAPELRTEMGVVPGQQIEGFNPTEADLGAMFASFVGADAPLPSSGAKGFDIARDHVARGSLDAALAEVRQVAMAGGDPVEAALLSGEIFRKKGLEGEALERFDSALARLPESGWSSSLERAWLGRGWCQLALGRAAVAREAGELVCAEVPGHAEASMLVGEALLADGKASAAAAVFAALAERHPSDPAAQMRLGIAARAGGDADLATTAFQRVLELDDDRAAARVELASLCLAGGDADTAVSHCRAALDRFPGYAEAAMVLAAAEQARGQGGGAVDALVDLLTEDAYHLLALQRLGEVLLDAGRFEDAARAFSRVLRFDPGDARTWMRLGDAALAGGRPDEAEEQWVQALEIAADGSLAEELGERIRTARLITPRARRSA